MATNTEPANPVVVRDESPTQTQARLRRERREAKIKAGGSSRLDKITSLSGRSAEAAPAPPQSAPASPSHHHPSPTDPEEVDISTHAYHANSRSSHDRPDMQDGVSGPRGFAPPGQPLGRGDQGRGQHQVIDDPLMAMLQQLMGGGGGGGGEMPSGGQGIMAGLPPGLAAMLGGFGGGESAGSEQQQQQQQQQEEEPGTDHLWTIAHALLALALGVYMVSATPFSGTWFSRAAPGPLWSSATKEGEGGGIEINVRHFLFWAFATAEVGLQSARFLAERGRHASPRGGGGWVGVLAGAVLPEPWRGWVLLARRYGGVYAVVVRDAMVVVFVLGVVAWWKREGS